MSTYSVNRVRREWSSDYAHKHIAGVYTTDGVYHSRAEVVASIKAGNHWYSSGGGNTAKIHVVQKCMKYGCLMTPYISTNADGSLGDNLDKLPEAA